MNKDYDRPTGFVRWGWVLPALALPLIAVNIVVLAAGIGSALNWAAVVICAVSGVCCFWMWRDVVASDAAHRARMREFARRFGAR